MSKKILTQTFDVSAHHYNGLDWTVSLRDSEKQLEVASFSNITNIRKKLPLGTKVKISVELANAIKVQQK